MKKKSLVRGRHDSLARLIFITYPSIKDDPELKAHFIGGLRNMIFDIGGTYTGYTSNAALEAGMKKGDMTEEHFYPRGQTAEYIVNTARASFTISRCIAFLKSRTRVHMTTAKENMNLRNYSDLQWREAYAKAGIELVEHEFERKSSFVYKVNGIEYNNLKDMAKAHGLSEETVRRKPKWSDWSRHERIT
jgi:hypothetical protein